jgi:AraC family transcriptional regulator, alkane utilization regulator
MDALSDVLKSIRLEGAVFLNVEFTEPWCVQSKFGLACIAEKLARAEHVMFFHYIVEGRARLRLDKGGDVIEGSAGDLILFAQDESHIMGSDLHLAPFDAGRIEGTDATDTDFIHVRHGGGGAVTRFVCGYVACGRSVLRPLLESLPPMLRIPMGDGPAARLMRELLRVGVRESSMDSPGSASTLAKLTELMFVEAMRRHVEALPAAGKGWLAGVRDLQVGRALALLHAHPDKAWTVDKLARESAISRSALAERFTALVGESPMKYLTRWRLALAAQRLRGTRETVSRIADGSGYESEAAFNRAFKREFGVPPASWRRSAPH